MHPNIMTETLIHITKFISVLFASSAVRQLRTCVASDTPHTLIYSDERLA